MTERSIHQASQQNPDTATNPVRSLDDLYKWLDSFLSSMPWEGLMKSNVSIFKRIDQATGYFYYLFQDIQYEPSIAAWIKNFNYAWGEFLDSPASWNDEYYNMLKSDPLFKLDTDKYESPDNWHSFNDFFARRLNQKATPPYSAEGITYPWYDISGNTLDVKTAHIENITDLLGDSPYKHEFENGIFTHITLDFYNYHRFHSPTTGRIVDLQEIDGVLTEGGNIIWDAEEHRYRYEQIENIGYQMLEKRVVIVIECNHQSSIKNQKSELIAVIPVGVAQVGSIKLNDNLRIGAEVLQGQELGTFLCGGSEVIVMKTMIF